jgi:virulence-associated protein VagC
MLRKPPQEAPVNEIKVNKSATTTVERAGDGTLHIVLPEGFDLPVGKVNIRQSGDTVTVAAEEPDTESKPNTVGEMLERMVPLTEEEWPDIDDSDLLPLRDIVL